MKKLALHWQILIGMALGVVVGALFRQLGMQEVVSDWIKPFGTIFINLLKVIAVPLILASLIKGVADLKDISKLSRMGGRTILIYIFTTIVAVSLGLTLVNLIEPGSFVQEDTRQALMSEFESDAAARQGDAAATRNRGPLQPLVDIVPDNVFHAASSNGNMLQVIFFAIFFGIALILIPESKSKVVKTFFEGVNDVVLKMIDIVMLGAPYGVFALLAALVAEAPSISIFKALGAYMGTVVLGLGLMIFVFYPLLVKLFTGYNYRFFLRGISPAQLLAFSTSSSAATLPVTLDCVEENLGVPKEVASFVLPVGATINMDGTSLYQAVGAIFIAQALGLSELLTLSDQLSIVVTATLASIGAAAVPGAGILMLIIVLESIGVPSAGIALIFAVDRPLDMCRTAVNVTGDAAVSMLVGKSVNKLG